MKIIVEIGKIKRGKKIIEVNHLSTINRQRFEAHCFLFYFPYRAPHKLTDFSMKIAMIFSDVFLIVVG